MHQPCKSGNQAVPLELKYAFPRLPCHSASHINCFCSFLSLLSCSYTCSQRLMDISFVTKQAPVHAQHPLKQDLLTHSLTPSLTHSIKHSFIHSSIHPSIHSFIHSFIHLSVQAMSHWSFCLLHHATGCFNHQEVSLEPQAMRFTPTACLVLL